MARALLRCHSCQYSLLDTFVALAGVRIPTQSRKPLTIRPAQPPSRGLHCSRGLWQSTQAAHDQGAQNGHRLPDSNSTPANDTSSTESIPWYLQVQTPTLPAPISPLLSSYDIPLLPEDPPPILQPLLEHLSNNIGLSNLDLLDLRHLSPPPALGSNLLMIIGTARSIKHLNVSADRFCRWLRSKYKLRPYADGLMGRQELKLKLRRRARRMKLAQTAGRTQDIKEAEEITTGWVCVNVGAVPDGTPDEIAAAESVEAQGAVVDPEAQNVEDVYENPDDDDTYIGFGSSTSSPRIVVQMFTEEKRLEMDLEGLWDFRNSRREKQAERLDDKAHVQESLWREKLHEPILELRSEQLRQAGVESPRKGTDDEGFETERK